MHIFIIEQIVFSQSLLHSVLWFSKVHFNIWLFIIITMKDVIFFICKFLTDTFSLVFVLILCVETSILIGKWKFVVVTRCFEIDSIDLIIFNFVLFDQPFVSPEHTESSWTVSDNVNHDTLLRMLVNNVKDVFYM